jgi:6-pyruvoyl-tetrahydropterin synthase
VEKITVYAKFHTGHRQKGYPGHCRFVHGHTWRGRITVSTEEFPRDELDMAVDFGSLKKLLRDFDHKIIVTADDELFTDPKLFEPEGIVLIPGKSPSVENVAVHVWKGVVGHLKEKFPHRGIEYTIEVEIQETENNFFSVERKAVV